jgi:hypothetical protein
MNVGWTRTVATRRGRIFVWTTRVAQSRPQFSVYPMSGREEMRCARAMSRPA